MEKCMKKIAAVILSAVLILVLTMCGDDSSSGNSNKPQKDLEENPASDFDYKAIAGGVEITKYTGTSIRVRIPEKIEDVTVTSVGYKAFSNSGIMEVYIPNSVMYIGNYAFSGCTGLTSVTIGNSVTHIGRDAFNYCEALTSITIPDSVTHMNWGTFAGCIELTNVIYKNVSYSIETERERRKTEASKMVAEGSVPILYDEDGLPREFYDNFENNYD